MSYETLLYDLSDGIAEIRLNRPQRLNAVTQQLYDELNDALGRAEAAREARVVLLTGEGREPGDSDREMARLLDGIIEEAKELGIDTRTPDEIERMKMEWKP